MPRAYSFVIPLPPVPASRARTGKGWAFYKEPYKGYKEKAPRLMPTGEPLDGPLSIEVEFICTRAKTKAVLAAGIPVGDIDNYAKAAYDAITQAGLWHDDRQIVKTTLSKRYAGPDEAPHTKITISEG